jgi:hypothetical protein
MGDLFASLVERTHETAPMVRPVLAPVFSKPLGSMKDGRPESETQEVEVFPGDALAPRGTIREASPDTRNEEPRNSLPVRQIPQASRIAVQSRSSVGPERSTSALSEGEAGTIDEGPNRVGQAAPPTEESRGPLDFPERLTLPRSSSILPQMIPALPESDEPRSTPTARRGYAGNSSSSVSPRIEQSQARPIVRVTIGRIEVKAVTESSAPVRQSVQSPRHQPSLLAEHLKRRNEGVR